MPSASTKSSQQSALPVTVDLMQDPVKNAISVLDKKLRNLEKRKLKLLETKKKADEGSELNQDQKEALERLTLVDNSLAVVKELQKNMVSLDQEYVKLVKKEQKRVKQEKNNQVENQSSNMAQRVVEVQGILGDLSEEVRPDFTSGSNGACLLTDDELSYLDKFYELINPASVEGGEKKLSVRVENATKHLINLVQGKDNPAFDEVSYKTLQEIVDKIRDSGYFDIDKDATTEPITEVEAPMEEQPAQEEAPKMLDDSPTEEYPPVEQFSAEPSTTEEIHESNEAVQPVNGVDLPPEVQQSKDEDEKIDFMGESEIQTDAPTDPSPPPLNPVSPVFVPRNLQQSSEDGWGEAGQNSNEAGWQSVDSNHQGGNQQGGGFRGRGGRGRGNRGRGRGSGGYRGARDGGNYRGGNRGSRGSGNYRGGNRGARGNNRGGERGGYRGGFNKPQQQQQQQQ